MTVSRVSSPGGTRERILDYVRSLILRGELDALRVDAVARDLGISKKTLYRHFASKDALVREVLQGEMDGIVTQVERVFASGEPTLVRLRKAFGVWSHAMLRYPRALPQQLGRGYPQLVQEIIAQRRQLLLRYSQVVEEGQRSGELRSDVPAEALGQMVIAMVDAVANPSFFAQSGLRPGDLARVLQSFVVRGLRAPTDEEDPA